MKKLSLLVVTITATLFFSFQIVSTQIKISVRNNLGKVEEGVRVKIFLTEEDYKNEKNAVQEHFTDAKGNVTFKDLQPVKYYVNAVKDNKTNAGNGELTDSLKQYRINKMTIIIQE